MTESIQKAILKTLIYADLFDYPLTIDEIKKYLIGYPNKRGVKEALSLMVAGFQLIDADSCYCLPGREKSVELRKRRQVCSRPKLKKAKRIASVLQMIPWIRLIGVTGALAMENSDEGDDIDLMIITSPQRLWLTRGLVVGFLRLTGQYRRPQKVKDRICPNLLISEDALEFTERDLFTAHEIVQMKPIYDRENIYQKFINANRWVFEFLPNCTPDAEVVPQQFNNLTIKQFNFLENLAYKLQLKYMEEKKTIEVTTPKVIRFHPQDIRQKVLDEYQKRVYDVTK